MWPVLTAIRFTPVNGALGQEQLEWIGKQLAAAQASRERLILLSHVVLHPDACGGTTMCVCRSRTARYRRLRSEAADPSSAAWLWARAVVVPPHPHLPSRKPPHASPVCGSRRGGAGLGIATDCSRSCGGIPASCVRCSAAMSIAAAMRTMRPRAPTISHAAPHSIRALPAPPLVRSPSSQTGSR